MSEVLIVSKTRMRNNFCVGGIGIQSKASLRLLTSDGYNQPLDTPFEVGDVWSLTYNASINPKAPHTEDVRVQSQAKLRVEPNIVGSIQRHGLVWQGGTNVLFGGALNSTGRGKGYISERGQIPKQSTGFWMPAKDLVLEDDDTYRYNGIWGLGVRRLKYVGVAEPISRISANTLVRVSLARWWKPENSEDEARCYLQLSGWYV